ncbi:MAG TPA: hypothetical protein VK506_04395 [Conexibacter sp.]|nr:hypothetical protein [Conexibacter sp.]
MFKASGWVKGAMSCPHCAERFQPRGAARLDEVPVLDQIRCRCASTLRDQVHSPPLIPVSLDGLRYPDIEIGTGRQMFQASALRKHGLFTTGAFFSTRNLAVLAALHMAIAAERDDQVRQKLLFAFTAILTRASKRYQWHPKRPLNAANQNYYIAPVFYEWNVYELFDRKVKASLRSDAFIEAEMRGRGFRARPTSRYRVCSADALDLANGSVDYVFTDPPFGSQIFYSDMNLFQEAWLGTFTNEEHEAVVDRSRRGSSRRSPQRYESIIVGALRECGRVLKSGGWLSMVFSNSSGDMWTLVQRAIHASGFVLEHVTLLDKGQRSVKGLTSGFENVVTADLILTMRKAGLTDSRVLQEPPRGALERAILNALRQPGPLTPTHVYLWVVTEYLRNEWRVDEVAVKTIRDDVAARGYDLDPATGVLFAGRTIAV